jgi:hypothetical protein
MSTKRKADAAYRAFPVQEVFKVERRSLGNSEDQILSKMQTG